MFYAVVASLLEKSTKEELMLEGFRIISHIRGRQIYVRKGLPDILPCVLTRTVGTQRVGQGKTDLFRGLGELPGRFLGIVERRFSFPEEVPRLKVSHYLLALNRHLIQIGGRLPRVPHGGFRRGRRLLISQRHACHAFAASDAR